MVQEIRHHDHLIRLKEGSPDVAANLPVDIRALYDAGKRLKEERERPVRIAVLVEVDAPDALVEAARHELHPKTANGIVDVSVIEPETALRVD